MSKYNAKKITVDGIEFDSEMESRYYLHLRDYLVAGILDVQLQPKYVLQEAFEKDGKKIRPIEYIADFLVSNRVNGRMEVIDIKGFETADFILKKKMFDKRYPHLKLRLITECPKKHGGGWIDLDELKKLRKKSKAELAKKLAASGEQA